MKVVCVFLPLLAVYLTTTFTSCSPTTEAPEDGYEDEHKLLRLVEAMSQKLDAKLHSMEVHINRLETTVHVQTVAIR
jgi:hypothetical protein